MPYRTAAGSLNQNDQIAVRDTQSGEHWTSPVTPDKVSVFILSADGTKLTYITGNGGFGTRRVYQATKGQADAVWFDGCFDAKSCGSGSPLVLGVTPDGNSVMYDFESEDPASPYYTATNRVMVLDVSTGQKTMPYVNQGLPFLDPIFSADASWMLAQVKLGDDFDPQYTVAARRSAPGRSWLRTSCSAGRRTGVDISNDGERIAWRDGWKSGSYPDPRRLHVYSRSTKTNWTAPTGSNTGYYLDDLVDLAPSGSAVAWHSVDENTTPVGKPWGAAVG
ncbi:hypothetical protein ABZX12_01380 [Kribbella sp. NPDC003505]|uniref:hypothetical protein n=1 Tax=Kribbella sp. NPDC003505 TaxID=3154448 RepID=UPI0033A1EF70